VVPSRLIKLGQQALAAAVTNVANGEPSVRCQLLASEFYRALKRELRTTSQLGSLELRAWVCSIATTSLTFGLRLVLVTVIVGGWGGWK
jgi:hypothetical protein